MATHDQFFYMEQPNNQIKLAALKAEYDIILGALKKAGFNKSKAAKLLGVDRKTIYNKIKKFAVLEGPETLS